MSIPNSVEHIGWFSFYDCTSLKEIVLPDSVKGISANAFSGCTSLTIYGNILSLCFDDFDSCTSLTNITIPESVDFIEQDTFKNCSPDLIIKCKKGSYAESYAKENNINYEYY